MRRRKLPCLAMAVALVTLPLLAISGSARAAANQCFNEYGQSGYCIAGVFRQYWQDHGGLTQQGMPISEPLDEVSPLDGRTYRVQYFERARFEAHPENREPYVVLLGQLGREQFLAKYPSGRPAGGTGERCFDATGRCVGGLFLDYWERNGGLEQQGYPISDAFSEVNPSDGKTYTVQYFERARFEYHPENAAPYNVLLGLVGKEQFATKYPDPAAHSRYFQRQGRVPDPVLREDVTGDGVPEYIYVTNGAGCGSCHGQLVTIFSGQTRIFEGGIYFQGTVHVLPNHRGFQVNEYVVRPNEALCCPSGSRRWTYEWDGSKFVVTGKEEQ